MRKGNYYLAVLCLLATSATAQENSTNTTTEIIQADKEYTGGEIVVTAERLRPVEQAGTTRSLTANDLEMRGSRNLAEAIRTMPGTYSRISNDGTERIDIRGFRTRHVILLLNGVPMNNTYDQQFDPSLIPVENISKIKVGYGNQSVLYGSGGLGGTINVITKAGEPGFHGSGEVEVGEGERYIGRATLSQTSEKVELFVGASHAEQEYFKMSDDFVPTAAEDGDERENSDYVKDNVLGSATIHLNDEWALGLVANYMQGEFGKPPNTNTNDSKYTRVEDYEGFGSQVTLNRNIEDGTSIRAALFYNELSELENSYDDNTYSTITTDKTYSQDATSTAYGGNIQVGRPFWDGFNATVAANLKAENFDADGMQNDGDTNSVPIAMNEDLYGWMLGIEAEQELFEKWVILGGISGNWQQDDDGNTDSAPSYMLGTTYDLFEPTMLHASYAHQIRFPSIKQLYDVDKGNPNLTKESSDNYEAGITQDLGEKTELDVTCFVRDVDDFIEKSETKPKIYQNFEQYLFYGVETTVDSQVTDSLNAYASYTYMKTENKSTDYSLQYRPEHVVRLGGEWTVLKKLLLFGNIRYVADQYADATETEKADDYVLVDLRATLAMWKHARFYVGVDNVFDENYAQSVGVPREGRTFYAGVKATF